MRKKNLLLYILPACLVVTLLTSNMLNRSPLRFGSTRDTGKAKAPLTSAEFGSLIMGAAPQNLTLIDYCYPDLVDISGDPTKHWSPTTPDCSVATDCYCFHVAGDMSRAKNPDGLKRCMTGKPSGKAAQGDSTSISFINDCTDSDEKDVLCNCLHPEKEGGICMFSDMRPSKIFSAITAARLAGVTHIIEEGRFGGLSAFMYDLHGFRVTSLEFLPLDGSTNGLRALAPGVKLIDGDGSILLPELLEDISPAEAASTMVIFDGEKRFGAYQTFQKIRSKVALAIFDDTNIVDGPKFMKMLTERNEIVWDTTNKNFSTYIDQEAAALTQLKPLADIQGRWYGGVNMLEKFHFAIVKGDAWY